MTTASKQEDVQPLPTGEDFVPTIQKNQLFKNLLGEEYRLEHNIQHHKTEIAALNKKKRLLPKEKTTLKNRQEKLDSLLHMQALLTDEKDYLLPVMLRYRILLLVVQGIEIDNYKALSLLSFFPHELVETEAKRLHEQLGEDGLKRLIKEGVDHTTLH